MTCHEMTYLQKLVGEEAHLRKFALRLTRNAADAQDLSQSTILRALEKKDYFEDGTNLFSWLSTIMFNIFISQYRHEKKFAFQHDPDFYLNRIAEESRQENKTDLATVMSRMKDLRPEHRDILVLVCVRGLRYEEVAAKLKIPVGTVRSRLSRARAQLQQMLTPSRNGTADPPPVLSHATNNGRGLSAVRV
ncbi:MAG: sigma-70 family RNA polymerase sigma factor [Alphaproteobacteria bacterium]|nr:sigma-70 family RNA polymerase sigma factor [Alphaproteobacteria bacterium]MDE2337486.1 sigma-70 family RNA polymerase sigma factor [Alphaproteobacteria bacterium]